MRIGFMMLTVILLLLSREDIRSFYLENRTLLVLVLLALGEGIVRSLLNGWEAPTESFLYECMLLVLVTFSRGRIGDGDLIVLAALTMFLSVYELWLTLFGTFALLLPAAVLLWLKEKNRQCSLPFLPFLTGGVLLTKLLEVLP